MAKGTIIKKGFVNIKERKYKNTHAELTRKLQSELESDLIRLFQNSLYCDVELVVDSSPILTHSCVLRARASRFYSVITTEFEVVCENGLSSIVICNGSFTYIRKFVENIYTNIHTPEIEDCIISYLRDLKITLETETNVYALTENHSERPALQNLTTPESDLFFTPKCSPSEIQKPIFQPSSFNGNDVTSYYKIVSVDDISIDRPEDNQAFEKELAEQDELFLSFKSIFSKGNKSKPKPNSLPLSTNLASSQFAKNHRTYKKNLINEDRYKPKIKLPLWKPNPIKRDINQLDKQIKDSYSIDEKLENSLTDLEEATNSLLSPDMDVSVAGIDSGCENSSSCLPEVSPRENTVSETSGVDLTEAANEEIPHDEAKPSEGSSASSEIGTWDAEVKLPSKNEQNGLPEANHLNDEDLARLDAMEKNMRDCEVFLDMERRACCCENNLNFSDDFMTGKKIDEMASGDFNYVLLDESLKSNGELNSLDIKTPPCSPRKSSEKSSSSNMPSGNYFIDASSLLDEDEILSPPVSLINFKSLDSCENNKESLEPEENGDFDLKEKERRQGELIFKTSIPHFSKHEVEKVNEVEEVKEEEKTERLRGGADDIPEVFKDEQVVPSGEPEIHSPDSLSVDCSFENFVKEPEERRKILDEPEIKTKKLDAESLPIVSGGVPPEDFSNPPSYQSSPHLRRRNESAPILSGGAEFIEEEKKRERKPSQNHGEAWVVNFTDPKPKRRHLANTSSESDLEIERCDEKSEKSDKSLPLHKKVRELKQGKKHDSYFINVNDEPKSSKNFPVEKSASLNYFIKFGNDQPEEEKPKPEINDKKKNIFSMFIDMSDDSLPPVPNLEREGTFDKAEKEFSSSDNTITSDNQEDNMKKSFYMFIESESPIVKRKLTPKFNKKEVPNSNTFRKCHKRTQSFSVDTSHSDKIRGSSQSLFDADLSSADNSLPYIDPLKTSKLPLPLSKSHSLATVNCEPKVTAWAESKEENIISGESWLKTKDVQITYTGKDESKSEELTLKKDSTFIIDDENGKRYVKSKRETSQKIQTNGFHLNTVEESSTPKSPFKSPKSEERDSGVVATEESDDSFVKLSDMDNFKNPYIDAGNKKKVNHSSRMSQSIPENSWIENKSFKISDGEPVMSRSTGVAKSSSGTSFACDINVSRSLSRLFPNLSMNATNGYGRKSSSPGGRQDTDPSDTQVSEVSELSSMQSSVEPSALEISTSETEGSTHINGASRLGEDLLRMFLEEISPDVVVEVGGRRMKAHKCILSSRCQYFAAMLSGGWVESAGNVISLQGFSYNAVHFALCHIYSGENRIPDSLNIIELATLADMLSLEGLKEVISHTLKVKYCHCFHAPCTGCIIGVLDCLPVAAAYGLDDLYRKCLRWITKHFVKVWPTKTFASLPKELLDKCYQHHVVHLTVDTVLDTILNIDKVRGSLTTVRWAETISRLITKLHDAAVKYVADHFSSILTSDHFLALGREAGWSVSRLEDSLMEATERLPPEQACWSHARLHRILSIATGPDPPPEMNWSENFIELLQCISSHVENNLIKQAPRAARSKAWRQMEPELRSRIQEAACLVLPDEVRSPTVRRSGSAKKDLNNSNVTSSVNRVTSRSLDIRQMKIAMTQANRLNNTNRSQPLQADQRLLKESRLNSLKPTVPLSVTKKAEVTGSLRRNQNKNQFSSEVPKEPKKATPSRFLEVKSRYLEPKSPQKTVTEKPAPVTNLRRNIRPLSSSDSSRNCSPAMRRAAAASSTSPSKKLNGNANRQHRDSIVSNDSTTTADSKKEKSSVSTRSQTPSVKTLSRLAADENMSTDSLCTDSLYSEKDATTKPKGKENVEEKKRGLAKSATGPIIPSKTRLSTISPNKRQTLENSTSSCRITPNKRVINLTKSASESKVPPPRRISSGRVSSTNQTRASPGKSSLASPRTSTSRNVIQRTSGKYDSNVINGNTVRRKNDVDSENNKRNLKDDLLKGPKIVSRSGTFLKDEPTILKKPQIDNVQDKL